MAKNNNKIFLYAEDEKELADEVIDELRDANIQVVHTQTATDAIFKTSQQLFDCIMLDMNLEQGTGDQVVEAIRKCPTNINHRTPVIMVSSHLNKELLQRIGKDIQDAIVKPFIFSDLIKRILKVITSGKAK